MAEESGPIVTRTLEPLFSWNSESMKGNKGGSNEQDFDNRRRRFHSWSWKGLSGTVGYNAATRNCSDFAKIGVEISAQKKVLGKETTQIPLIGTQAISTPAALFRDSSALKNAEVLKGNTQNIKNQLPSKNIICGFI